MLPHRTCDVEQVREPGDRVIAVCLCVRLREKREREKERERKRNSTERLCVYVDCVYKMLYNIIRTMYCIHTCLCMYY